jgi:hypothetical protein
VEDSLAQLWEDLLKTARARPPGAGAPAVDFVPGVLMEFYSHCDGCELLDGALVIRGKGALERVRLNDDTGVAFANLKNGARLLYVRHPLGHGEQVMSQASLDSEPRVLAHSMLEFFQGAAQSRSGS